MTNEEILNKMHPLHLMLADELIRICNLHNLKTFMIAGTLLGAIRHKGFIPWDDDMDFGMSRNDFEKFLMVAPTEMNGNIFELKYDRNEKFYAGNYAKLMLKGTSLVEDSSKEVNMHQGIFIDIFPVDAISDNKMQAFIQLKSFWVYRNLLWVKCGYGDDDRRKQFSYKVTKLLASLFSISALKSLKHSAISKYSGMKTEKVVVSDGTYGLSKETLKSEWVSEITYYPFENRSYPGISDYDSYLSYFYGDYMKLPPEDKRNHHGRLMVEFGPYL